jgi:hypothetical protein
MITVQILTLTDKHSFIILTLEAISKKSFGPISVLSTRFNSLTYLGMPAG